MSIDVYSNSTELPPILNSLTMQSQSPETAPVYLFCCALSLASISAFLKAGFVLKFFAMMVCIGVQGAVLWSSNLYSTYQYTGKYVFWKTKFPLVFEHKRHKAKRKLNLN